MYRGEYPAALEHAAAGLVVARARVLETRSKEIDAAIELYETALRLDPESPARWRR